MKTGEPVATEPSPKSQLILIKFDVSSTKNSCVRLLQRRVSWNSFNFIVSS